ncbi:MAG: ribose-phosphate pyrophosphokinase-like domain-containing protein, partial [Patescibacteria group bacterium]
MSVFTLPNPRPLEISVAKKIDKQFARNVEWRQFTNGEWFLRILKKPTRAIVLCRTEPPGDHIIQTLTLIDTLKRNGCKNITLVVPYFGYCRQDRVVRDGDHLPADLFTKLFKTCGASRIITIDLHSKKTEQHSALPLTTLDCAPFLVRAVKTELK